MLTLYHNNQEIVIDTTEYYVRELASGLDEVIFDLSIWDPVYTILQEEANIVDRAGQRYLVKQIDAGAVVAKVVCQLDLDEWKSSLTVGYDSDTKTVAQQITAVKPAGWTVLDYSASSIGRTIKGDYTPLQVCEACRDLYSVYIRWDNKNNVCMIYPQAMGTPVGSFATRELNLKEINYKGKSNNFATRLYAVGKDGLTFASINDGKPYVDNNTYSSRVICAYWQDERYTVKEDLLAAAQKNLAKIAVPERSYDCAIVDLQATDPLKYNNLDFSLFTAATLIDDVKEVAVNYMVIERHVWPYHPDRNDVIFNSAPVKIQNSVIQIEQELTNPNSAFAQIWEQRSQMATEWLTNANSHVYVVPDNGQTGIKEFLFVNGDEPIETATQVMRLNSAGLGFSKDGVNGPFTNAFVFDPTLGGHLVADFITAGTLTSSLIQAGVLADLAGKFSLNMTTGALSMADGTFSGTIKASTIKGSTFTNDAGTFSVDSAGNITGATITGSSLTSVNGSSSTTITGGKITTNDIEATGGSISLYGDYSPAQANEKRCVRLTDGAINIGSYQPSSQSYGVYGRLRSAYDYGTTYGIALNSIYDTGIFANAYSDAGTVVGNLSSYKSQSSPSYIRIAGGSNLARVIDLKTANFNITADSLTINGTAGYSGTLNWTDNDSFHSARSITTVKGIITAMS